VEKTVNLKMKNEHERNILIACINAHKKIYQEYKNKTESEQKEKLRLEEERNEKKRKEEARIKFRAQHSSNLNAAIKSNNWKVVRDILTNYREILSINEDTMSSIHKSFKTNSNYDDKKHDAIIEKDNILIDIFSIMDKKCINSVHYNDKNNTYDNILMSYINYRKGLYSMEIIKLLIEKGINLDYQPKYGETAISVAISLNLEDLRKYLTKVYDKASGVV
jgi:hypothetical protein